MSDSLTLRLGDYSIRPISDEQIAFVYLRLGEQGLLPTIFYEGVPGIRWFLQFYDGAKAQILGCFRHENDSEELCGVGWINSKLDGAGFSRADAGMAFFRHATLPDESTLFGQMLLGWGFENFDFDVIYGTTPDKNRAAVAWMRRVGFDMAGPIPAYCVWQNQLTGGMVGAMPRDRFMQLMNTAEGADGWT